MKYPFDEDVLIAVALEAEIDIEISKEYDQGWRRVHLRAYDVSYGRMMFQSGFFTHTKYYGNVYHQNIDYHELCESNKRSRYY